MRGHADECPCSDAVCQPPCTTCTCGAGIPVIAPSPQVLGHTAHCPVRAIAVGDEACTCGTAAEDGPKDTDDNPYRDVARSRELARRAEAAWDGAEQSRAMFLLELAQEARLLAELQGKWEY